MTLWTTLLSVIVGGVIGSLSPWFIERKKEKNEKKKKRAEKFEELVAAVYEFDYWADRSARIYVFLGGGDVGLSPASKVEAIAAVHFPQFQKKIAEVRSVGFSYQQAAYEGAKSLAGKTDYEFTDFLRKASNPYVRKRDELLHELKKFAGEEFSEG
jgi:hypothetical protein